MSQQPMLVVVDDEQNILDVVSRFGKRAGFEVVTCSRGRDAIAFMQTRHADLALVDLRIPDVGGLDVLRAIREADASCQAVLMTGYASVETAVEAIKRGALDYVSKPLDFDRLQQLLTAVREESDRRRSVLSIESDIARRLEFCGMIGRGAPMQDVFAMIRRLAPHVRTALITGETGTGKELVARALHQLGRRADRRFVPVNCSAVVESLLSSELFERADGGTMFFDEIADMPLPLQAQLLRVLEVGEVHRVGSLEAQPVNVHVIAATNRDLRAEVAAGRFRSDLYYRLTLVDIALPPLRERREDIPYLTASFVRETSERLGKPLTGMAPAAERLLTTAKWEGNVRELRNVIERACILADGELITERELSTCLPAAPWSPVSAAAAHAGGAAATGLERAGGGNPELLATVERDHIQRALLRAGGNKKAAAKLLGLSRRALYRRLERLDLSDTIARRPPAAEPTIG